MAIVSFCKYSVYGNNFVLVDETKGRQLDESGKSLFAHMATDTYFGIGADNLLVLQRYDPQILEEINSMRQYWTVPPFLHRDDGLDYIFRMFEPNGQEAFSCGNGLLCAAHYLHNSYGIAHAGIVTEIPSACPKVLQVGVSKSPQVYRINMGSPSLIPDLLIGGNLISSTHGVLGMVQDFPVSCQMIVTKDRQHTISLKISGFLTYTGEPHLVVFEPSSNQATGEAMRVFQTLLDDTEASNDDGQPRTNSVWLLHQIGLNFNRKNSKFFPYGLNVNFARVINGDEGIISYRCFERGIKKETLACGTGAIAIASAAHQLGKVKSDTIRLCPIRCRWYIDNAEQFAIKDPSGTWWLEGEPRFIFSGAARME